jgi:hypothetical protein
MAASTKATPVKDEDGTLPEKISWRETTIVRKGGVGERVPPPEWALALVKRSWDDHKAFETPSLSTVAQCKAALHQCRRAAKELGYGLSAQIEGTVLKIQAKERKVVTRKS